MCNVAGAQKTIQLAELAADSYMNMPQPALDKSAALQYQSKLASLEHSQAAARLGAKHSMADGAAQRETLLRQAAQDSGRAITGYGASNLSLDSGSILSLIADQAANAQRDAANITRQTAQEVEQQRMNEEYYAGQKNYLHALYESNRKKAKKNTLVNNYNYWKDTGKSAFAILTS